MTDRLSERVIRLLEAQGYVNVISDRRSDARPLRSRSSDTQFYVDYVRTVKFAGTNAVNGVYLDVVRLSIYTDFEPKTGQAKLARVVEETMRILDKFQIGDPSPLSAIDDAFIGVSMDLSDGGLNV